MAQDDEFPGIVYTVDYDIEKPMKVFGDEAGALGHAPAFNLHWHLVYF